MIDDIQDSFTEAVERTTWIDKKTKAAIKEKVTYIKRRIGFPEWILDPDEVEDYYEQVRCKNVLFFTIINRNSFVNKRFCSRY